jgi:hypothetical protein
LPFAGFRIAPPGELRAAVGLIRNRLVRIPVDRYLDQRRHVGKVPLAAE